MAPLDLSKPVVRFAAIGLDHLHAILQVGTLARAGGEFVAWYGGPDASPAPLAPLFERTFPQARRVRDPREILEDESISLVASAAIPDQRAQLGIDVMRHGKDYLVDKPGAVTLEELAAVRKVQEETGRLYAIYFSERLESPATERAGELVLGGAIGHVLHVAGFGPHQLGLAHRPPWFFDAARSGGILADLASHQADQFLYFTGCETVEVAAAHVANWGYPERPAFQDFGELLLRGNRATGYARVDWYTPDGLGTWGDVRLVIVGSEGTLEVRKNVDVAGRGGGNHLFLVDRRQKRHLDCAGVALPFAARFLRDVYERSDEALPQDHCFQAMELALRAQRDAVRLGHLA